MRLFGHPVHVMLIHFPVALWPAHFFLHVCARLLPGTGIATVAFWLLLAACGTGMLALATGAADLLAIWRSNDERRLTAGLLHAVVNGTVLAGFCGLLAIEYAHYPPGVHGTTFLSAEGGLLLVLGLGNYLGGRLVWDRSLSVAADATSSQEPER